MCRSCYRCLIGSWQVVLFHAFHIPLCSSSSSNVWTNQQAIQHMPRSLRALVQAPQLILIFAAAASHFMFHSGDPPS